MEFLILSTPGMYKDRRYLLRVPIKQVLLSKSSTADLTSFSPSLNSSNSSTVNTNTLKSHGKIANGEVAQNLVVWNEIRRLQRRRQL